MPINLPHHSDLKNIIILNDYCHVNGGASKIAIDEAVSLAAAGFNVIFLGACGPVGPQLQNSSVQVVCLHQPELINFSKNPAVVLQGIWNFTAAKALRKILLNCPRENTIIHLHGYTKALTSSPMRVASQMGYQSVCTLHDFFAACPNGAQFDYVEGRPCLRRCLSVDCITANCDKRHYVHKLYRVVRSVVQKYWGRLPSGIFNYITLSEKSALLLKPYLPTNATFYPLQNLIDVDQKTPVDASQNKAIVAVGRLDIEKGIEPLLRAAAKAGVPLTLVGDGPLKEKALSYPNVKVTGWVTPTQVMLELEKARCLVFPSLWYETYGLVVAEAASRGIPAIVSDVSAPSERMVHGVHGLVVQSGDEDQLVECFEKTRDDNWIRNAGLAAYAQFWQDPPTRTNHTAGLIEIYGKILTVKL